MKNVVLLSLTLVIIAGASSALVFGSANAGRYVIGQHHHGLRNHKRHRRHHRRSHRTAGLRPRTLDRLASYGGKEIKQVGRKGAASGQVVAERPALRADRVPEATTFGPAKAGKLQRAGQSFDGDLRNLPASTVEKFERPEVEEPEASPRALGSTDTKGETSSDAQPTIPEILAAAPAPIITFDGLDFGTWGAGHPPDTNGDVGPTYYIQTVNSSIGIYNKGTGASVAAFTFNTFMSQGNFGNLCDTNNFGDPVVLYDSFEDRWVITDFAFTLTGNTVNNPPGAFQCFAVSKTNDPVSGGWNYYSINVAGGLGDYPKFGIWPDGIYMTASIFNYPGTAFLNPRVYAFNKAQMYAGAPTIQIVSFDAPSAEFTVLPANARLQTGTPPAGSPNYYSVVWQFTNAVSVYKFHVDWNRISTSTFTGPFISIAPASWANAPAQAGATAGGTAIDTLGPRLMMQNQYTNIGGVESLWNSHTVQGSTTAKAAPRFYQVNVTGGAVAGSTTQAFTLNPDASAFDRYMPSVAVDRGGNMSIGYTASNSATFPSLRYAARLATDPVNSLNQTEQVLMAGTGTQNTASFTRWGDYSAMTLDPNGCTFWYTNEYYAANGTNDLTRIGSFRLVPCTTVGNGTLSGTVTSDGVTPISGATVVLGSRTTTTNGSGAYSFTLPAGTYPTESASFPGRTSASAAVLAVPDGSTLTQNFTLPAAPASACPADTTQSDFQLGIPTNTDLTTSAGDVTLTNAPILDQSNTAGTATGTSFATTSWGGQTFIPAVNGQLAQMDVQLFCSGCTGTTPNLTLSIRATSGGLPTGADLATATIPGFSSGSGIYYSASFGSPATLTSGTQYALVLRPVAAPSVGGYFWIRSSPSTYANGQRVISTDNGATWTADSTRDFNFRAYMQEGYAASGDLISAVKDANPANLHTPTWDTLSWTATTPASTSLKFQVAASNNIFGPYNYVGPDTTAGTFYTTSGGSLAQFNGKRYLRYRAFFATTNSAVTPTLSDVTTCFTNNIVTAAGVTISGRVATADGGGIRGAMVSITDTHGIQRNVLTNAFGYYTFDDVQSGGSYVMRASARRFTFTSKVLNVSDSLSDINFVDGQ